MSRKCLALAVWLAAVAAQAQPLPGPSAALVTPGDPSAMGNMAAAMAAAVRPGDETLSCEALRAELEAARNDPAMKAYQAATTERAAEPPAAARAREAAPLPLAAPAEARGAVSPPPSPGVTPAFPGMAQQAQAIASMQAQMNALAPVLPLLARNQHLVQLAAAKQCAWLNAAAGFGGSAAGAAVAGAGARGDER